MKLITEARVLNALLKRLGLAILPGATNPIITNIMVSAGDNKATFIATDLNITISYTIECVTEGEATQMLIPFSTLSKLSALEEGPVTIELQEEKVYLKGNSDVFCLGSPGKPAEFPKVPKVADDKFMAAPEGLMYAMGVASPGVSKDELAKPAMMCVCLEVMKSGINVVSTDGHSLYLNEFAGTYEVEAVEELLVPASAAKALDGFDAAKIGFNNRHAAFVAGPVTVFTKRSDNKYPAYRGVIPVHEANVTVKLDDLMQALNKALIVAADLNNNAVTLAFGGEQLELKAASGELNANCAMQADTSKSPIDGIVLNGRILKRVLTMMDAHRADAADLAISVRTKSKAITVRLNGRDSITVLAMPIVLNS